MREIILNRIAKFFGYGDLNSDIWFVGMEEGFNDKGLTNAQIEQNLIARFNATYNCVVVDCRRDMTTVSDHMKFYSAGAKIQPTFNPLIRILFSYLGNPFPIHGAKGKVIDFQIYHFGSKSVMTDIPSIDERLSPYIDARFNHCSLDLMPFPSRTAAQWNFYENWANKYKIPEIETRQSYESSFMNKRKKSLICLINLYKPKIVIFYGHGTHLKVWKEIMKNPQPVAPSLVKINGTNHSTNELFHST